MRYLLISAFVVVIDMISKFWAVSALAQERIMEVTSFINFRLAYNRGAAFSFLDDAGGWQKWFFVSISTVVSLVLIWMLVRRIYQSPWSAIAYAFLLGGAVGNLIDRVRLGYVVDMIDIHYATWHWPTFNVADSAISIAVVMILLEAFGVAGQQRCDA